MLTYIEFLKQLKITVIKYSGRWRQIDSETSIDHTVPFELQRKNYPVTKVMKSGMDKLSSIITPGHHKV